MMKVGLGQYRSVLMGYVSPFWRQALVLLAFLLSGVGLQLVSPYLLSQFIDAATSGGTYGVLVRLAVLFLVLTIGIQLLSVVEAYVAENLGLRATNELRADLTEHVLGLDMTFHNAQTPGVLIERIDGDVGRLKNFFSRFAVDLLGNGLLMLGVLIALAWIDWRVGAALTLFTVLTFVVVYVSRNVAVPHFRASRQADAELFGFLEERLAGTEDVRSSGATAYVMRRFFEQARKVLRTQLKVSLIGVSTFSLSAVLFSLGSIIALGGGAILFQRGEVTIGTVFLIFRYTQILTGPIEVIGRQVQDLQQAGASILRISDLLGTRARLEDAGTLERLKTKYLDVLLLYRPDTLMEPEEVADAFDELERAGKVRHFGVSNQHPRQMNLLKKYVCQLLVANQLQLSITNATMITSGFNVNMENDAAVDRDGYVLDYCREHDITIQPWSPFQYGFFEGVFLNNDKFPEFNAKIGEVAERYGVSNTTIAIAWLLRHPAKMQPVTGTMNIDRLRDCCKASEIHLTREEWYAIYRAAGNTLP